MLSSTIPILQLLCLSYSSVRARNSSYKSDMNEPSSHFSTVHSTVGHINIYYLRKFHHFLSNIPILYLFNHTHSKNHPHLFQQCTPQQDRPLVLACTHFCPACQNTSNMCHFKIVIYTVNIYINFAVCGSLVLACTHFGPACQKLFQSKSERGGKKVL